MKRTIILLAAMIISNMLVDAQGLIFEEQEHEELSPMRKTRNDTYHKAHTLKEYTPHVMDQGKIQ